MYVLCVCCYTAASSLPEVRSASQILTHPREKDGRQRKVKSRKSDRALKLTGEQVSTRACPSIAQIKKPSALMLTVDLSETLTEINHRGKTAIEIY